jgi:hypothetical protein
MKKLVFKYLDVVFAGAKSIIKDDYIYYFKENEPIFRYSNDRIRFNIDIYESMTNMFGLSKEDAYSLILEYIADILGHKDVMDAFGFSLYNAEFFDL